MKIDETLTIINKDINLYLKNKNEFIIDNPYEKEGYKICIKMIKLLEVFKETDQISNFYCTQIVDELITLLTLSYVNNCEIKYLYIRKSAEWLMKWFYEYTNTRDLKANFRILEKHIKNHSVYNENKDIMDNVMKIFKETSLFLHTNIEKSSLEENFRSVLFSTTTNEGYRIIRNHANNIYRGIKLFIKLYSSSFEMSQEMRFKKMLSNHEYSELFE
ncbi:hypothetical protein [Staphylococcus pseudintermedius]|uniref:hypothetical protein n=1 Tax=Staphylococcus pseudintermedius TaxID=283734 RepID=UPI001C200D7C|nr:hypothetical protein [Staphylococcus pseudintermedius]